jgi:hypothetical protein
MSLLQAGLSRRSPVELLSLAAVACEQVCSGLAQQTGLVACPDARTVDWLSACPRAISYRAALRGYQGSAHTAACGR